MSDTAFMPSPKLAPGETDYDAIVIGAGHNGLVTAAYLARGGMRTLLIEARSTVGGTAASEPFAGTTVNICNCDHLTFRTTPVMDELRLSEHGLEYIDIDPGQHNLSWASAQQGQGWSLHRDIEQTIESLGQHFPEDIEGYRRYTKAAVPAVEMIFEAASEPPTLSSLTRLAVRRRLAGAPRLMSWSRRSAADMLRSFFSSEAVRAPAALTGPMVWGISPEAPGSGLGALTHAIRHVSKVGRPVGGSGALPESLRVSFEAMGGELRLNSAVDTIMCTDNSVSGVALSSGEELSAPIVVSACNPHDTFLRWLKNPPAAADDLLRRWKNHKRSDGFESKIDAVLSEVPKLKGFDHPLGATTALAPSLADIDRGAAMMRAGQVLRRPGVLFNVPTILNPSLAPPDQHLLSLEVLYTPFALRGGWPGSNEPERWLNTFAELCEPGFLDTIIDWRAMTPDVYEREFNLPGGHATTFAGGPLAAFRNPNPELTEYETAVDGLYLTGAATFPGAGIWGASGRNCATVILEQRS